MTVPDELLATDGFYTTDSYHLQLCNRMVSLSDAREYLQTFGHTHSLG